MQKYIIGENGIGYILGADGLYYPERRLLESSNYSIGKYGRLRKEYLKENHKSLYLELVLNGRLMKNDLK